MSVTARYGDPTATLDALNEVVRLQLARRSVRRFGPRDVTADELTALVAAAQSPLTSSNLQPWSVVAVRDPERKQGAVLHRERYDAAVADAHIDVYDRRLAAYNDRHGLAGDWSGRVLARLRRPESMAGRHRLRETLQKLGLASR